MAMLFTNEEPTAPLDLVVTVFGEFSVSVNGAAIDASRWKHKHPRLLFQMLCLAPGHRLSRDEAAEALWPQAGVQASSNRLYHTLHSLRGILGDGGLADARRLVQLQAGTLWLDAGMSLDVDAQRFAQAVSAARACNGDDAALPHLETARALHRGTLALPATAGDWFASHRHALLRDHVWVLEQLGERLQAAGRVDDAIDAGQALVQAEPSNEAAHRRLIELYDAQNRPDLMAQQYTACSRYLRRDLGVEPSAATRRLVEGLAERAAREPAAAAVEETAGTAAPQRYTAPPRATPLLGREAELRELQQWLLHEQGSRLITIAAAGGIGKTRLAAALAEQVQDHFADGVHFIALGEVQRPSLLAERICQALGLSSAEQSADQVLPKALGAKRLLMVLDRFEHLLEAAPRLAQWLQAASGLHIVVTSQCPLKLRAERVYELPPLSVHAPHAALALFVQTAARVGFDVAAPHHEAQIRSVCARVGSNALAIELAAAQLAVVSLPQLPHALRAPLQVLVGLSPDDEAQHASLQATVSWSISLLAPSQARLLALLSVFAADFSGEDAQAVLGTFFEDQSLQPLLRTLLDRHLLFRRSPAADEAPGRLAMADAVRECAQQMAAALPLWSEVRAAHGQHFAQLAASTAELVRTGHGGQAHGVYRVGAADIERSLQWHRERGDRLSFLGLCWKVGGLHTTFGVLHEAVECLLAATTIVAETREERDQSAWCHYMLSRAKGEIGDSPAATRAVRTARQLARGSQDTRLLGLIGTTLAMLRCTQLRVAQAIPLIDAVIRDSRRLGAINQLAGQYSVLANCLATRGDYRAAAAACEESLDCALASNNPQATLWALVSAAEVDIFCGRLDRARASLGECQLLRDAGYSVASELHVAFMSFYVAFEAAQFDQTAAPLAQARAVCRGAMAERTIMFDIAHEFVLMETWRFSEVRILRHLSDQQLPFDSDFSSLYVAAHCYGMFLQAINDEWAAVLATAARLRRMLRLSGNAMWAAWVAQSAAMAAQQAGCTDMARQLLVQSHELLASRDLTPTARQLGTWRSTEMLLSQMQARPGATAPRQVTDALEQLGFDLCAWCDVAAAAPKARPRWLDPSRQPVLVDA